MGILNITPDSFSDGGQFLQKEEALKQAEHLILSGADLLDIGGESSRPGAESVSEDEEQQRVVPIIKGIRKQFDVPISVDTVKAGVAKAALDAGANWINDISALRDDADMAPLLAETNVPVVLMHRAGAPQQNYQDFKYDDLVENIKAFFVERIEFAKAAGIRDENIILDPGVGFGKSAMHNCELINQLGQFKKLGYPVLIGTSRKSFIGKLLNVPMDQRLPSTIVSNLIAVQNGADIVRVHDVADIQQAMMMMCYIQGDVG